MHTHIRLLALALPLAVMATAPTAQTMLPLDANADGQISQDEVAQIAAMRFAGLDSDGDGNLTQAEFTDNFLALFAAVDGNSDKVVTRAELRGKAMALREALGVTR